MVLGALLVIYLIGPIVAFVVRYIGAKQTGFSSPGLFGSLGVSAIAATTSTAIIALLGIPLAYCLVRYRSRLTNVVGLLVQLPLAIPPLMSGMLLIFLVGPYTAIGKFFHGALTESLIGVVLAQTFVAAPFLIVVARATFATIPDDLFDAAATLGHREFGLFWRVALPVARDGIYAGLLLAWLRAFGEYGATVILAYHPYSLPIFTYLQFSGTGLALTQAPTAIALVVAAAVVLASRVPLRSRQHGYHPPDAVYRPRTHRIRPLRFAIAHSVGGFDLELAHEGSSRRIAILGPSGSGKSMTLRALAGLLGRSVGRVELGNEQIGEVDVGARRVGYLPQRSALLPHLGVATQLTFGVGARPEIAQYWIERLGLIDLVNQPVDVLSGGQRQRVALARALSRDPILLLLDEPFSALDSAVRREMQREVRQLQRDTGITTVVVTHDFDEAAFLADEILIIDNGHLIQSGTPEEIYRHPVSETVAHLVGIENVHEGTVNGLSQIITGRLRLQFSGSEIKEGTPVLWAMHPDDAHLGVGDANYAQIVDVYFRAGHRYARLLIGGTTEFTVRVQESQDVQVGQLLPLHLPADLVRILSNGIPRQRDLSK